MIDIDYNIEDIEEILINNVSVQYIIDCIRYSEFVTLTKINEDFIIGFYKEDDYKYDFKIDLIKLNNQVVDIKFNNNLSVFSNGKLYHTKNIKIGDAEEFPKSVQLFQTSNLSVPVFNKIIEISNISNFLRGREIYDGIYNLTFQEVESLLLSSIIYGCSLCEFVITDTSMYAFLKYDDYEVVLYFVKDELSLIGNLPPFLDFRMGVD